MSGGKKILDGLQDALSRNIERYTNICTAHEGRMTDLERAAQLLVHDLAWRKLELLGRLKHVASVFAAVRCEAEAAMRERAASWHDAQAEWRQMESESESESESKVHEECAKAIRALPLMPEEPATEHHLTPNEQRIMDKALRRSLEQPK